MIELRKTYHTTVREVASQTVIDTFFIPKALLHEEIRENEFSAIMATARAFGFSLKEPEPKHFNEGEFTEFDLGEALGISGFLAHELFEREDIFVSEMSPASLRSISTLVMLGIGVGKVAAPATATGAAVLIYCAGGMLVVSVGVLAIGGALKWLGY